MEPLKDLCSDIDLVRTKQTEIQRIYNEELVITRRILNQAQKDIKSGVDTTHDLLEDGLIAIYGSLLADSPEVRDNFTDIAKRLEGKEGEPVLVISRWNENPLRTSQHSFLLGTHLHSIFNVGIINNSKIVFDYDKEVAYLPTSQYAQYTIGYVRENEEAIVTDHLVIADRDRMMKGIDLGLNLHTSFQEIDPSGYQPYPLTPALRIAIGYDEIRDREDLMNGLSEDRYIIPLLQKLDLPVDFLEKQKPSN